MECGSHQNLISRFLYDPVSGDLFNQKGKLLTSHTVNICGKTTEKHRLIWFIYTGYWPDVVDHKNRNHNDNRWCNLRDVSQAQNLQNKSIYKNNASGFRGVSLHKGKWRARISINRKTHDLSYWEDRDMAYAARLQAEWDVFGSMAPEFN
jgi:hypothetical protein